MIKNTFKNIVLKKKWKATFSHNRMSSNNICLCIIFDSFVHNSLWTSACKYTSYLSLILVLFCVDFRGCFYVSSVYLTSSVPRWRTKNSTWPVCCISYFLSLSLSLILGCLSTIFNVMIDHMYKGSFVISVCIGKRKILLLRPTQWKYLSVYQLHHIVR